MKEFGKLTKRALLLTLSVLLLAIGLVGCGGSDDDDEDPILKSVAVNGTTMTVEFNEAQEELKELVVKMTIDEGEAVTLTDLTPVSNEDNMSVTITLSEVTPTAAAQTVKYEVTYDEETKDDTVTIAAYDFSGFESAVNALGETSTQADVDAAVALYDSLCDAAKADAAVVTLKATLDAKQTELDAAAAVAAVAPFIAAVEAITETSTIEDIDAALAMFDALDESYQEDATAVAAKDSLGDKAETIALSEVEAQIEAYEVAVAAAEAGATSELVNAANMAYEAIDMVLLAKFSTATQQTLTGTIQTAEAKLDAVVVDPTIVIADDYVLELTIANNEITDKIVKLSDSSWKFLANGELTITYKATVYEADAEGNKGQIAEGFEGQVKYLGILEDPDVGQEVTSFDAGIATIQVKVPNSEVELYDEVNVRVTASVSGDLLGQDSNMISVVYFPTTADGGSQELTTRTYPLGMVGSADTADRVKVYIGDLEDEHVNAVMDAIKAQLVLYNNYDFDTEESVNPIRVVGFSKALKQNGLDEDKGDYVFTALLDLPSFDLTGYIYDNAYLLRDNGDNYYAVESGSTSIRLAEEDVEDSGITNKFKLIDSIKPTITDVFASAEETEYLGSKKLLAVFSEAVERTTAEVPENWVLNGHTLESNDIDANKGIRVLDIYTEEDATGQEQLLQFDAVEDSLYKYYYNVDSIEAGASQFFNGNEITTVANGKTRTMVIISLTARAAKLHLYDGNNLLQARSISDWAGVTDTTENNIITTQDFTFEYEQPEAVTGIVLDYDVRDNYRDEDNSAMKKESPEQFLLTVNGPLYIDEDAETELDLTLDTQNVAFELSLGLLPLTKGVDYQIRELEDDLYIIEFLEDWTMILGDDVYHNETLTARIDAVDELADEELGETKYYVFDIFGSPVAADVSDSVVLEEDTKSPMIDIVEGFKDIDFINAKTGSVVVDDHSHQFNAETYKKAIYSNDVSEGVMKISMDEPCQLLYTEDMNNDNAIDNDEVFSLIDPAITPSDKQKEEVGVPVPTFEYVKISGEANAAQPAGYKVDGIFEVSDTPATQHDWTFTVIPDPDEDDNGDLEAGAWKLVVRSISDDIGNTMATEEIYFEIEDDDVVIVEADTQVDPYVTWAYAKNDIVALDEDDMPVLDEYGDAVLEDHIFILYSREMDIDVIRASTYQINGKPLEEDVDITRTKNITMYRKSLVITDDLYEVFWGEGDETLDERWTGDLVHITLPGDFFIGDNMSDGNGETNALTFPLTISAIDDGVEATLEELQFGNNDGSNTFELLFDMKENNYGDNYFGENGIENYGGVNPELEETALAVPPIEYIYNAEFIYAETHWASFIAGDNAVTSIALDTTAVDTAYDVDDTFDIDGLVVTATYEDATTAVVTGYTYDVPDMTTAGDKEITVTYMGETDTFTITVVDPTAGPTITADSYMTSNVDLLKMARFTVIATISDATDVATVEITNTAGTIVANAAGVLAGTTATFTDVTVEYDTLDADDLAATITAKDASGTVVATKAITLPETVSTPPMTLTVASATQTSNVDLLKMARYDLAVTLSDATDVATVEMTNVAGTIVANGTAAITGTTATFTDVTVEYTDGSLDADDLAATITAKDASGAVLSTVDYTLPN